MVSTIVSLVRVAMSLFVLVSVAATFAETASRVTINPFNFFGYFTLQSNILAAVILLIVAIAALARRTLPGWFAIVRAAWVTYMVIVGVVYNTLLVGTPGGGGVALEWANHVVHIVFPIYILLDWILVADRPALPWKRLWLVVVYPLVWAAVVLVRGATDGWVPYPFLDPSLGYGSIAVTVLLILVAVIVVAAAVWGFSRLRVIRMGPAAVSAG